MSKSRRTRPGKGRAFLKFLIGLLLVFILGAGAYLFVLEYDHMPEAEPRITAMPQPTPLTQPTDPVQEQTQNGQTEISQAENEGEATLPPVSDATPMPEKDASVLLEGMSVPARSQDATFGMTDFRPEGDLLRVSAYLADPHISSETAQYYLVASLMNGDAALVFDTWPVEDKTGLDIDLACFSGKLPGSALADGWYCLGLMAVDGENSCFVSIDDTAYSFVVNEGQFIPYTE